MLYIARKPRVAFSSFPDFHLSFNLGACMHLSADNDNPKSTTLTSRLRSGVSLFFSLLDCCGDYGAFTMQQEAIQKFVFSKQYIFASCVSTEGIRTARHHNLKFLYETVHASRLAGTTVFFGGEDRSVSTCYCAWGYSVLFYAFLFHSRHPFGLGA